MLSKKKRSSQKFFRRSPQKNVFQKIFQALNKTLTIQKLVLCPRAEDRPIFEDLRPRGLGQGLDLRGQGLQNVSSRTPPVLIFFKSFLFHKNWRGEGEFLLKNVQ